MVEVTYYDVRADEFIRVKAEEVEIFGKGDFRHARIYAGDGAYFDIDLCHLRRVVAWED